MHCSQVLHCSDIRRLITALMTHGPPVDYECSHHLRRNKLWTRGLGRENSPPPPPPPPPTPLFFILFLITKLGEKSIHVCVCVRASNWQLDTTCYTWRFTLCPMGRSDRLTQASGHVTCNVTCILNQNGGCTGYRFLWHSSQTGQCWPCPGERKGYFQRAGVDTFYWWRSRENKAAKRTG